MLVGRIIIVDNNYFKYNLVLFYNKTGMITYRLQKPLQEEVDALQKLITLEKLRSLVRPSRVKIQSNIQSMMMMMMMTMAMMTMTMTIRWRWRWRYGDDDDDDTMTMTMMMVVAMMMMAVVVNTIFFLLLILKEQLSWSSQPPLFNSFIFFVEFLRAVRQTGKKLFFNAFTNFSKIAKEIPNNVNKY